MRLIFLCLALCADPTVAQDLVWTQRLPASDSANSNDIVLAGRLPDGNIVVDIERNSFRFEMSVLAPNTGTITTTESADHFDALGSIGTITSGGDLIRYVIAYNGLPQGGNLASINTVTGDSNWLLPVASLRHEMNTDNAGNLYVLQFTGPSWQQLLLIRYSSDGLGTPISILTAADAIVVPLAPANGMPGWVIGTSGYEVCRLAAAVICTALPLTPSTVVRRINAATDGSFYVELLDIGIGYSLARFSAGGALLWQRRISGTTFGWDTSATGVALMLADGENCTSGQLGMRTLTVDGTPGTVDICLESFGYVAESARFVDLGSHWAVQHDLNSTPRIIDKSDGHAYWLRMPVTFGDTVAHARLIRLVDGEFIAVTVERQNESSERIHAKRVRLVDTLFRDNFEYFGN